MLFDTLTALFAVKFIMVRDLEAEARMAAKVARPRHIQCSRQSEPHRQVFSRPRPARAARATTAGVRRQAGIRVRRRGRPARGRITAKRAEPEPVQSIEGSPPLLALAPPDPTPPAPPDSPLSAKVEAIKPRSAAQMTRFQLHVVQPRHKGARWGGRCKRPPPLKSGRTGDGGRSGMEARRKWTADLPLPKRKAGGRPAYATAPRSLMEPSIAGRDNRMWRN